MHKTATLINILKKSHTHALFLIFTHVLPHLLTAGSNDRGSAPGAARSRSRLEALVRPFVELDRTDGGLLTVGDFTRAIHSFGVMLSKQEVAIVAGSGVFYAPTRVPLVLTSSILH